ncbi:MAG: GNAT family N-acetyltransferase, partial [Burkholderiaceae bacterium]|nr:GNAT family N-acetyltransferase [Burkholderiaceae bacterium]
MTPAQLRGARVTLRQWRNADHAAFAQLNADPVAMEFFPSTLSPEESDAMVQRCHDAIAERGWGFWCLEIGGACAGFTGLNVPTFEAPFMPGVEIGWRLHPRYWGHGYATEAARLALDYGFGALRLQEIVSFTAVGNVRSRAVMERIGMRHDAAGDFDHPRLPPGHRLRRHVLY